MRDSHRAGKRIALALIAVVALGELDLCPLPMTPQQPRGAAIPNSSDGAGMLSAGPATKQSTGGEKPVPRAANRDA